MKRIVVVLTAVLTLSIAMSAFAEGEGAAKLSYGANKWVALHYLLQTQANFETNDELHMHLDKSS